MQLLEKLAKAATRNVFGNAIKISNKWEARVKRTSGRDSYAVQFSEIVDPDEVRRSKAKLPKESFYMEVSDGQIVKILQKTGSKGKRAILSGGSDSHQRGCTFVTALVADQNAFIASKVVNNGRCKRRRPVERKGRISLADATALQLQQVAAD